MCSPFSFFMMSGTKFSSVFISKFLIDSTSCSYLHISLVLYCSVLPSGGRFTNRATHFWGDPMHCERRICCYKVVFVVFFSSPCFFVLASFRFR
jgi:hypothetical protein